MYRKSRELKMKRFDIKNKASGQITHSYTAEEELPHQPEWGESERMKWDDELTSDELASATSYEDVEVQPAQLAIPEIRKTRYLLEEGGDWIWEDNLTQEQKDSAFASEEAVFQDAIPARDAVFKRRYTLPATYEVIVTDLTSQIKQQEIDAWVKQRNEQAEIQIQQILGPMDDVTHLMLASADLLSYLMGLQAALNITDEQLPEQASNSKQALISMATELMPQIQAIRDQRDVDIEAYIASHPVS